MRLLFIAMCFALLSIGQCLSDAPLTEAAAKAKGENILAQYLKGQNLSRSELDDPFVELAHGDAIVYFRLKASPDQGMAISLGANGTVSLSPYVPINTR